MVLQKGTVASRFFIIKRKSNIVFSSKKTVPGLPAMILIGRNDLKNQQEANHDVYY
jgi:hypothetical protein